MLNRSKILYAAALSLPAFSFIAASAAQTRTDFVQIERGRYLTVAADCVACHTVPESGKPFAGGRAIETPFGNLLSPNITPDRETGIGAWTDAEFTSALKAGIGRGGSHIYPAMPYVYYTKMSDGDAVAIRAYLQTIAPVVNDVVSNQLPFPYDVRASLRVWNALYFKAGDYQPVSGKSGEWNRGAYLVEGPMHCGACHTSKSALGGDLSGRLFQGFAIQGWYAPNITGDTRLGIGSWSVADIAEYLKTGHNAIAGASGPMAEEVELSSSRMNAGDLKAIAVYLKDQAMPAYSQGTAIDAADPVMKAGGAIFKDSCSSCHKADGTGVPGLFPMLSAAPSIQSTDTTSLIRVVVNGAKTVATDGAPTGPGMPSYGWQLSDAQIAAVLTYVRNTWGNAASAVLEKEVRRSRSALEARAD